MHVVQNDSTNIGSYVKAIATSVGYNQVFYKKDWLVCMSALDYYYICSKVIRLRQDNFPYGHVHTVLDYKTTECCIYSAWKMWLYECAIS